MLICPWEHHDLYHTLEPAKTNPMLTTREACAKYMLAFLTLTTAP